MKRFQKFWQEVANDIMSLYKSSHPEEWKKEDVEIFLGNIHRQLVAKCKSNTSIANTLGCWHEKSSKLDTGKLKTPSYDTFRRIFITKTSQGSSSYRNVFAIYIGYDSYVDYILKKGIKEEIKESTDIVDALKDYYQNDPIFTTIRIPGDRSGEVGELSMKDYYVALSHINYKDLKNRESLIQNEQESASRKVNNQAFNQAWLSTDYLSFDILKENERIVIIGNPGIGKSTYARWICFQWANDQWQNDLNPIYIQLRDLDFSFKDGIVFKYLSKVYFPNSSVDKVKQLIFENHQNCVFVFDGFDELNHENKTIFEKEIVTLTKPKGKTRYVLLSRPYGLMHRQEIPPITLQIDGFTISSIENYIQVFLEQNPIQNRNKNDLLKLIENNSILNEYAHNPLMLSYIVLIYLKKENPHKLLAAIESVFDLQSSVFKWMKDYANRHPIVGGLLEVDYNDAQLIAYELLMEQQFVYRSEKFDFGLSKPLAIDLNRIGIGKIEEDDYDWHFSFNTVTFQEFLAAHHYHTLFTVDSFVYLLQNPFFWNFAKMILGNLSKKEKKDHLISIFKEIDVIYQKEKKEYLKYLYYSLLSETNPKFLKQQLKSKDLNQLFSFYEESYFDVYWKPTIKEALQRIYYKLSTIVILKKQFHDLLCKKMLSLQKVDYKKREGNITAYTLLDITILTDSILYEPFVDATISTIEFLVNRSKTLLEKMSSEKGDGFFEKIISLETENIEINNILFIIYQIIVKAPKQGLLKYQEKILELTKNTPIDTLEDISKLMTKVQSPEKIFNEFIHNLKSCEELTNTSESYYSIHKTEYNPFDILNEDDDEPYKGNANTTEGVKNEKIRPKGFPIELINLAGSIYKIGYAKIPVDGSLIKKSMSIYLEKALQPQFIRSVELQDTSDLIIHGVNRLDITEVWDSLFEFIYRVDSQVIFEVNKRKQFEKYITNHLITIKNDFNQQIFHNIISGIQSTYNGKYGLLKYREDLINLVFNILKNNHSFFTKDSIDIVADNNDNRSKIIESIINTPRFAYDKKFFIDQLIKNGSQYYYIKYHSIPFLFEYNFPFFQDDYWNFLFDNFDFPDEMPIYIIDILLNNGLYWYSSNLSNLKRVLEKSALIVTTSKQNNDQELDLPSNAMQLLSIISKTLKLLKESSELTSSVDDTLIKCTGELLEQEEIIKIYKEKGYWEAFKHNELLAYILQYYYTQDSAFAISIDFEDLKSQEPSMYKSLLISIIELFSDNKGVIQKQDLESLKPVLGSLYKDIFTYIDDYKVLYHQFERETFEELL